VTSLGGGHGKLYVSATTGSVPTAPPVQNGKFVFDPGQDWTLLGHTVMIDVNYPGSPIWRPGGWVNYHHELVFQLDECLTGWSTNSGHILWVADNAKTVVTGENASLLEVAQDFSRGSTKTRLAFVVTDFRFHVCGRTTVGTAATNFTGSVTPTGSGVTATYTGETAQLVPGTLRGYRGWRLVDPGSGLLRSITAMTDWETATLHAGCDQHIAMSMRGQNILAYLMGDSLSPSHAADDVPAKNCSCGIYAKHNPFDDIEGSVMGVIEGWGKAEVGSRGFRCRHARVVALAYGGRSPFLKPLEKRYKVPVFHFMDDLVCNFPPINVAELLGKEAA
jgi:hypothetical protein